MTRLKSPLLWAFLLTATVFAGVLVWLLADPATSRGDALKTSGLAGGATAVLYGLWLNDRRRRVEEARHAVERDRISDDRFAKAVELLGHEADQVRLGAMHALAGLARARPDLYGQTVIDVLCAYLRRPFRHPNFGARITEHEELEAASRERQVRRTAQQLIRTLLPHATTPNARGYGLDLAGARLDRFTLPRRRVAWLGMQRTEIVNGADFSDTVFEESADFTGATVRGDLRFDRAKFRQAPEFRDFTASGKVSFVDTEVPPDTILPGAD
ncbi:pentapeptide repeat-containing protein [Amycolatopsis sp. NPDC059021]|uniref:pentapeptide repeat-containing protein n=1 Tax=Amycolatopsis sp. NPDC059021 TaxID=3346704 RepID=UPI0036712679